jgi:Tol biopolymer transport system component
MVTITPTPSPTLIPSPIPQTPVQLPDERLAFVASTVSDYHDSTIAFVNGDGNGLEFPDLFEPFRRTGVSIRHLVWSPNGRYLAFDGANETYSCGPNTGDCFTTNYGTFLLDYSRGKIIKHIGGTLTNPSWAPDGQWLVVSVGVKQALSWGEADIGDLFILDVRGGQIRRLTDHPYNDLYPAWSPDGQWIAFVRFNPDIPGCYPVPQIETINKLCNQASLYLIRPDGSDLRLLLESVYIQATISGRDHQTYYAPAWSPDSQWLAILMGNEESAVSLYQDIALVNAITGEVRVLTDNGPIMDLYPTWSPDGRRLAFVSDREGNDEIYIMSAEGKDIVNLTQCPADEYAPAWSPSGQRIAFLSDRGTDRRYKLYIVNADGVHPLLVNDEYLFASSRPAWLPIGLH